MTSRTWTLSSVTSSEYSKSISSSPGQAPRVTDYGVFVITGGAGSGIGDGVLPVFAVQVRNLIERGQTKRLLVEEPFRDAGVTYLQIQFHHGLVSGSEQMVHP